MGNIQQKSKAVVAHRPNKQPVHELTNLNIDCLEELFEWLSIPELLTLRRTCKRLKRVVDHYLPKYLLGYYLTPLYNLKPFSCNGDMWCNANADSLKLLNIMRISHIDASFRFNKMKKILNRIEFIHLSRDINVKSDTYGLLKYCKNIKFLKLSEIYPLDDNWLHHQYPTLEYIRFCSPDPDPDRPFNFRMDVSKLVTFFCANPQIHTLWIISNDLKICVNALIKSGVKFDELCVDEYSSDKIDPVFYKEIYDKGFYKRLHLNCFSSDNYFPNFDTDIGLEKFSTQLIQYGVKLPPMPQLKEIQFGDEYLTFFENVWDNIESLQHFDIIFNINIASYLRNFRKLKHFYISCREKGLGWTIDLPTLNKERETLIGACKTTIYVQDKFYMATKFALPTLNYRLIELKRMQVDDFKHQHQMIFMSDADLFYRVG